MSLVYHSIGVFVGGRGARNEIVGVSLCSLLKTDDRRDGFPTSMQVEG